MKSAIFVVITALCLGLGQYSASVQVKRDTVKVLFVGNSYTYVENLHQIVSNLADGSNTKLITRKSTLGGTKLSEHWKGERGLKSKEIIRDGNFDIVVLQEHSMGTLVEKDSVKKYEKLFCDFIREHGAKPYIYLTWARENAPQNQEIINKVYAEVGKENKAEVVPAGNAWALAREWRPEIKLFDADGSHPSKIGTFLTACVFVKSILHELPTRIPNAYKIQDIDKESVLLMNIDSAHVSFCRKVVEKIAAEDIK